MAVVTGRYEILAHLEAFPPIWVVVVTLARFPLDPLRAALPLFELVPELVAQAEMAGWARDVEREVDLVRNSARDRLIDMGIVGYGAALEGPLVPVAVGV